MQKMPTDFIGKMVKGMTKGNTKLGKIKKLAKFNIMMSMALRWSSKMVNR